MQKTLGDLEFCARLAHFCSVFDLARLAETKLPTQTPKFYYGDISNETTNYIIITERVPFVGMGGRTKWNSEDS